MYTGEWQLRSVFPAAILLGLASVGQAQTIINLHAVDNCTAIGGDAIVPLSAGTYVTTAIGPAEGGQFMSWNAWGGAVSGCGPDGFGCVLGWWTLSFIRDNPDLQIFSQGGAVLASTEARGLINRHRAEFRVCRDTDVLFSVPDSPGACGDNIGGVSILIDHICEADLDEDDLLTVVDFLEFQNRFAGGDLSVDFDCDETLTLFDFLAFQNTFDAGCP